ncbi:MAG: hypothetical protein QHH02_06625 [Syntrophomonadaceae bacterium]|nr:hypothetical protein [Syntrophomonadaceae bacterium]
MVNTYWYALVIFDKRGCGKEFLDRIDIEKRVDEQLANSGWDKRGAAVVIDPELESWVWSDSPEVANCLGWKEGMDNLRHWLADNGLWPEEYLKPSDPKLAVENVMRRVKKPRSSAIYQQIASRVSFERCIDQSFIKIKRTLRRWFKK